MLTKKDNVYYTRRAHQERQAAEAADNAIARAAHLEMARAYERLIHVKVQSPLGAPVKRRWNEKLMSAQRGLNWAIT